MRDIAHLIEPLIPALRRYAFALTRDSYLADDLVQDCLERAVKRWYSRRPHGDIRAWLFTILHNLFVDDLRRNRRRPWQERLDGFAPDVQGGQESGLLGRDVVRAMQLLPVDQRSVLLLVAVEELSYDEASLALGVPIGTVMSRLYRARKAMHELLDYDRPTALRRVK